jgi:D-lactate dehydrogenase (cytochrome)
MTAIDALLRAALPRLGERISTNENIRAQHAKGEDWLPPRLPDAVAMPTGTDEVAWLVGLAAEQGVPIVPFGAGTSLEGHVTPVHGGLTIDLSRMTRILSVSQPDLDCRIEAGVTRQQLNAALRSEGMFFPVDPGSACTIGGMCATRASGTNAVRYGTIRENVLGLTVVTADGRVVRTGGRARKSAAGYDLTHLFIGSEGTLGIITEIQLRLQGIPEAMSAAVCQFATLEGAVETVIATLQSGIPVARIELLDDVQMQACIAFSKLEGYRAAPTLFLEFHGSAAGVAEQSAAVQAIAAEFGGERFAWATAEEERSKLWKARHDAYWACLALRPGSRGMTTDVAVPISRLADALLGCKADIEESGLVAPIVGHVGDGNFHTVILIDPDDPAGNEAAFALNKKMVNRALSLGGTCTGEHGIGIGKREFLLREAGIEALDVMRAVKHALDPRGLLNPGKLFLN